MATKKRTLLPKLEICVSKIMLMSRDLASLEYMDNAEASKRLKRMFMDFRNGELKELGEAIFETRKEIVNRPRKKDNRQKSYLNLSDHLIGKITTEEDHEDHVPTEEGEETF